MLNTKKIEAAKPKDKPYKLSDEKGLYLFINTSGGKSWRLDYTFMNKRKTLTLGKFPYISLAEARDERDSAKKLLAQGKDPGLTKKQSILLSNASKANTFKAIAEEWYSSKLPSWSPGYAEDVRGWLDKEIIPYIGNDPIDQIKPISMLTVLKAIESRGAYEIARKARIACSQIFRLAVVTERAEINPVLGLAEEMIKPKTKNFPFLATKTEMTEFMFALKGYTGNLLTRYATELIIYTAVRPIELTTLKWANIDFAQQLATVEEDVVKKDRVHLIPLSSQAISILNFLKPISGNGIFVFPNRIRHNQPMSTGAILRVIRNLGFANRASGHGFRHQFSTVLNEHGFNKDWIEKQLNHEEGNVRGIYNHAQYLNGRREMMQWYADYIEGLTK